MFRGAQTSSRAAQLKVECWGQWLAGEGQHRAQCEFDRVVEEYRICSHYYFSFLWILSGFRLFFKK